ncbi:hypothetical protein N9Z27_00860 [Alphaproteobacteria bacterium]|nr:hypothetical protein [Alphaproteobacteria bacterium]
MDTRAQYFIQVLEKIGSPLMAAIINFDKGLKDDGAQAKTIAGLLAKSVESGIALGELIDIGVMGEKSDSMRVALAGVSADLIGDFHRITGKTPGEKEIQAIATAMQAVLTFSENFTPSQENVARLDKLVADGSPVDVPQIQAQYMQAFGPIITAIAEFPFGHQEIKLMSSVSSRLIAKAEAITKSLNNSTDELTQKRMALGVLKALIPLYDSCHRAETARVMAMSDDERAAQPQDSGGGLLLDPLWERFETRATLLETLVNSIFGVEQEAASGAGDTQAPASPAVAEPPAAPTAPVQESSPPDDNGNPMAMFSKKPTDDAAAKESTPSSPPPVQPSSPPTDNANPMSMFAKKPSGNTSSAAPPSPPTTPPSTPPVEKPVEQAPPAEQKDSGSDGDSGNNSGNPMSFFKNPPKD